MINDRTNGLLATALVFAMGCGSSAAQTAPVANENTSTSASAGGSSANASASVGPSAAVDAPAGASSAQRAIEQFFAAVAANDEAAALRVLSARRREARSDAEAWGLFWSTWRTSACTLVSMGAVSGEGASGDGAADATVTLRCGERTRESHLRLQRAGDAWFWDEN